MIIKEEIKQSPFVGVVTNKDSEKQMIQSMLKEKEYHL
jgi:hypothetical protein